MISCVLEHKCTATSAVRSEISSGEWGLEIPGPESLCALETLPWLDRHHHSYFPSLEVARSLLQRRKLKKPPSTSREIGTGSSPLTGSFGASNSGSMTPYSTGITPPSSFKPGRRSTDRSNSSNIVASSSPEYLKSLRRSNSNLASAFAASFSLPFALTASASSSPPGPPVKRMNSPIGSYGGLSTLGVTWGATTFMGQQSNILEEPRSGGSTIFPSHHVQSATQQTKFKIKLKNQDQFDLDGYSVSPLLNSGYGGRYEAYRNAYAYMLFIWDMPIVRTELLKYSRTTTVTTIETNRSGDSPLITLGRKGREMSRSEPSPQPIGLKRCCSFCNAKQMLPFTASTSKCGSCQLSAMPLVCLLCDEFIRGRATPCLACGHALHTSCRSLLHSQSGMAEESYKCIAGCGCRCSEQLVVVVEWPEERPPPQSSASSTIRGAEEPEGKVRYDEGRTREDVAYASLAKNLVTGSRNLRPKTSQIWRGKGKRVESLGGR